MRATHAVKPRGKRSLAPLAGSLVLLASPMLLAQEQLPRQVLAYRASNADPDRPARVPFLTDVQQVVVGENHACARNRLGQVFCWGSNGQGQLGDGTTTAQNVSVFVRGLAPVEQLAAGNSHTCARTETGHVWCWGSNSYGQSALGTNTASVLTPRRISGLSSVVWLTSSGESVCAVLSDGTARCWGANFAAQLGDGTRTNRTTPVAVVGLSDAVQLELGGNAACARSRTGAVFCWGANDRGQLGIGADLEQASPRRTTIASGATVLAVGDYFACARTATDGLRCWGEVGPHGGYGYAPVPVPLPGAQRSPQGLLVAGGSRGCAEIATHGIECFSTDVLAQAPTVERVALSSRASALAVRNRVGCAVLADGTVECWGPRSISVPIPMPSPR